MVKRGQPWIICLNMVRYSSDDDDDEYILLGAQEFLFHNIAQCYIDVSSFQILHNV